MPQFSKPVSLRCTIAFFVAPAVFLLGSCVASTGSTSPTASDSADPIALKVKGADAREGLLGLHVKSDEGKVWLELPAPTGAGGVVGEYLYVEGLVTGLGSNPVGLDRGQLGPSRLITIRRLGDRVLFEEPNLAFRALSDDPAEMRATRESFAPSVLWATTVEDRAPDGRVLVDLSSFLIRDAHGVVATLKETGQGVYKLDADRSAADPDASLAFPDNVVFESILTYSTDAPGALVAATAPDGSSFSVVQRQSFVRLPDDHYVPREFDPRAGSFAISFQDYAAGLDERIEKRWIVRHRVSKTGPDSELVYYVDPGIPEPVRSAVVDGASWWADAFTAAGFPNLYRVELLPEDAHPLDTRFNVIEWVHRSTRGWSYGGGVIDPRTGEMIKGHVNLGSLRVRQDRLIFEGLLGTAKTGSGDADDPVELALARIRQLSAHEVGHTLGFTHNFAASTYGRASVMDYPAPFVRLNEDETFDVSEAYGTGIGAWDTHATRFAYSEFGSEFGDSATERQKLDELIEEARDRGYLFVADDDARPPGAAHPLGNLWDNGRDPVETLVEEMKVRRLAINRFGEANLPPGSPLALLEEVFATVYFRHRYQLEAAVKSVGGLYYGYPLSQDPERRTKPVDGQSQRRALEVVLAGLSPAELDIPETALELLVPRAFGLGRNRELLEHGTSPAFDALGAARTAADLVLSGLLQPERAARLVDQHRRDAGLPGFSEVLNSLVAAVFEANEQEPRLAGIQASVRSLVVSRLTELADDGDAQDGVRALAEATLERLGRSLGETGNTYLVRRIERYLERGVVDRAETASVPAIPPGSPIGEEWGCSLSSRG